MKKRGSGLRIISGLMFGITMGLNYVIKQTQAAFHLNFYADQAFGSLLTSNFLTFLFFFGLFFSASIVALNRVFKNKSFSTMVGLFLSLLLTISGINQGYLTLESLGPWAFAFLILIIIIALLSYLTVGIKIIPNFLLWLFVIFVVGVLVFIFPPSSPYFIPSVVRDYILTFILIIGILLVLILILNWLLGKATPETIAEASSRAARRVAPVVGGAGKRMWDFSKRMAPVVGGAGKRMWDSLAQLSRRKREGGREEERKEINYLISRIEMLEKYTRELKELLKAFYRATIRCAREMKVAMGGEKDIRDYLINLASYARALRVNNNLKVLYATGTIYYGLYNEYLRYKGKWPREKELIELIQTLGSITSSIQDLISKISREFGISSQEVSLRGLEEIKKDLEKSISHLES